MLLSEFGGIGFDLPDTDNSSRTRAGETFVYGFATTPEQLLAKFAELVRAADSIADFDGWCWTQLTDVEKERNGLMTADRQPKIPPADLRQVIRVLGPTSAR